VDAVIFLMPLAEEAALVAVIVPPTVRFVPSKVKLLDPPKLPELLNWTCVLEPPGEPPPPPAFASTYALIDCWVASCVALLLAILSSSNIAEPETPVFNTADVNVLLVKVWVYVVPTRL
jgi:hypothetical protein